MKVVVTGATGNVGTSLLRSLAPDPAVDEVVGIARRTPQGGLGDASFVAADVAHSDLVPLFRGADVVVHLAWLIQPSHRLGTMWRTNVHGTSRVLDAVAEARVPALVYASSIGAYSPGPKHRLIDESWPTGGIQSSFYSRHKAEVEKMLDRFEDRHPRTRVVRLRPGLIFKREAASGIRKLFLGPFVPRSLLAPQRIRVLPVMQRLALQAVHSYDVAEAYRLAITSDVRGAFNVAADPVLDADELARVFSATKIPVPLPLVKAAAHLTWLARVQPTPSGWVDLAVGSPLMDTSRAASELGWKAERTSGEALVELLQGLSDGAELDTPPLERG